MTKEDLFLRYPTIDKSPHNNMLLDMLDFENMQAKSVVDLRIPSKNANLYDRILKSIICFKTRHNYEILCLGIKCSCGKPSKKTCRKCFNMNMCENLDGLCNERYTHVCMPFFVTRSPLSLLGGRMHCSPMVPINHLTGNLQFEAVGELPINLQTEIPTFLQEFFGFKDKIQVESSSELNLLNDKLPITPCSYPFDIQNMREANFSEDFKYVFRTVETPYMFLIFISVLVKKHNKFYLPILEMGVSSEVGFYYKSEMAETLAQAEHPFPATLLYFKHNT